MKIILTVFVALFALGCSEDVKKEQAKETTEVIKVKSLKIEALKAPELKETKVVAVADEKAVLASCTGCHGAQGEKKALGKSAIIKGWDTQRTIDALNGYKNNTYGGALKGVMQGQVSKLNETQIKTIAEYFSGL